MTSLTVVELPVHTADPASDLCASVLYCIILYCILVFVM